MRLLSVMFALAALTAGCATFPDVLATESQASREQGYPSLAPIEDLLAAGAAERVQPSEIAALDARAARLRARAAALRRDPG
ncbi:MAG: hypothetical protein Q7J57_11165 [Gemmobacter sp.]|nr:hypothetical protein [Gemmobacter sp.]